MIDAKTIHEMELVCQDASTPTAERTAVLGLLGEIRRLQERPLFTGEYVYWNGKLVQVCHSHSTELINVRLGSNIVKAPRGELWR